MAETLTASLTDAVSGPGMMANLREIARWQKLSGSPEELEHMGFLETRMRDYGFRTKLHLHDAYISLPGAALVTVDGTGQTCITHSFGRTGSVSGVPVYLGRGTPDDFLSRDLAGRILLLEGMATPATALRASDAGAAGQLHISHHEHIHEMCISPIWGNPGTATLQGLPTTVACSVANADGIAIRDTLAAGEQPLVTLTAEVDTGWRKTPLLVCEIDAPHAEVDTPFIMLSGHNDTWYFGVMDNGSANAGMLEAARLCAQHHGAWQRGLRVCFWSGHSHGRYSGSAWYADTHWDELDRRCAAHVNVDSLGGVGASVLDTAAAMTELSHLAAEAVQAHSNQTYVGSRKARNSDESFVGIGVPSMLGAISEQPVKHAAARNALGWWWHTPHDLIDKVDEANLVRDTRVLTQVLFRLLSAPVLPLDHAATARALLAELSPLGAKLEGRLDLSRLIEAATRLRDTAAALAGRTPAGAAGKSRVNAALMRASRALVPVDYTPGDRFAHAAALPSPAWTAMQPIRDLAETEAGSDAGRFALVDAQRALNRLAFAVREAQAALDAASQALN